MEEAWKEYVQYLLQQRQQLELTTVDLKSQILKLQAEVEALKPKRKKRLNGKAKGGPAQEEVRDAP